jgi:hypothetical protein
MNKNQIIALCIGIPVALYAAATACGITRFSFDDFPHSIASVFVTLLVVALCYIAIVLFQTLWNTTMPQVFKLPTITFWQAVRLLLLAGILFGGLFRRSAGSQPIQVNCPHHSLAP